MRKCLLAGLLCLAGVGAAGHKPASDSTEKEPYPSATPQAV
ncbi:MAG: hypothetical protein JWN40_3956, partial [Phycisphaerales bacterium]|nr:hypothetical protein [Phycisphaerales bacterium]